jgi:hypothetical protein
MSSRRRSTPLDFMLCLLVFVALGGTASAQAVSGEEAQPSEVRSAWFERIGLRVRNTFDGSKNEKEPASFTYVDSDIADSCGLRRDSEE